MPNSYFRFKKFAVHQDACAMKVCTDACLFGAWTAEEMQNEKIKNQNVHSHRSHLKSHILDIGAGTGLLSLMLAQKVEANIDAVELDEQAANQARENVFASPWADRIKVYTSAIQSFQPGRPYDFIISNPPFYENDLKGPAAAKNTAHHSSQLTLNDLMVHIKRLLNPTGKFALLLPYYRTGECIKLAHEHSFYVSKACYVRQTTKHQFFRSMLLFSSVPTTMNETDIAIKDGDTYTAEFVRLLKDYYLYL